MGARRRRAPVGVLALATLTSRGHGSRFSAAFIARLTSTYWGSSRRRELRTSAHKVTPEAPHRSMTTSIRLPVFMGDDSAGLGSEEDTDGSPSVAGIHGDNNRIKDLGKGFSPRDAVEDKKDNGLLTARQEEHLRKLPRSAWDDLDAEEGFSMIAAKLQEKGQIATGGGPLTPRRKLTREEWKEVRNYQCLCDDRVLGYAKKGRWKDALVVLQEEKTAGRIISPRAFNTALRAVGTAGLVRPAIILINEIRKVGLDVTVYNYGAALNACAKAGAASAALMLLDEMRLDGIQPNEIVYTSAIKACGPGGHWREVLGLLERMEDEGTSPNGKHYNAAISVLGSVGRYREAMRLLAQRDDRGIKRCTFTYVAAIDAAGKGGEANVALALLNEMLRDGLELNLMALNTTIFACAHAREPSQKIARAVADLLDMAFRGGVEVDHRTYSGAMMAMAQAGQVHKALGLLDVSSKPPNAHMYSSALTACRYARVEDLLPIAGVGKGEGEGPVRKGDGTVSITMNDDFNLQACAEGLTNMREHESAAIAGTESVVYAAIRAAPPPPIAVWQKRSRQLGRGGGEERDRLMGQALGDDLLQRMESDSFQADAVLLVSLMELWGDAPGNVGWRRVVELLDFMKLRSTPGGMRLPPPCSLTYAHAIGVCGRCGQPDEALTLFQKMQDEGVRVNLKTYLAAMRALLAAGPERARGVLELFKDMCSVGVKRDTAAYEVATEACAMLGDWEQAMELLAQMRQCSVKPTTRVYNAMLLSLTRGGRWYRCLHILGTMGQEGELDEPNLLSYQYTIAALSAVGEFKLAMELLPKMTAAHLRPTAIIYELLLKAALASDSDTAEGSEEVVTHMLVEAKAAVEERAKRAAIQTTGRTGATGKVGGGTRQAAEAGVAAGQGPGEGLQDNEEAEERRAVLPGLGPGVLKAAVLKEVMAACIRVQKPKAALKVFQGARVVEQLRKAWIKSGAWGEVEACWEEGEAGLRMEHCLGRVGEGRGMGQRVRDRNARTVDGRLDSEIVEGEGLAANCSGTKVSDDDFAMCSRLASLAKKHVKAEVAVAGDKEGKSVLGDG